MLDPIASGVPGRWPWGMMDAGDTEDEKFMEIGREYIRRRHCGGCELFVSTFLGTRQAVGCL